MKRFASASWLATFALAASVVRGQACDPSLIFKSDAVELVRGKEVEGKESVYADHFRYRYQFASEENKAEFLKNPGKYEIQLGGSCARMGPLSGPGSTSLYAVHDARIYIFASESCKKTFLAAPEQYLETDDPIPATTSEATSKGRALLEQAIIAMGGANKVDSVRTVIQGREKEEKSQGQVVQTSETLTLQFPDRIRQDHTWGDSGYSIRANAAKGWFQGSSDGYGLHEQQCRALHRQTMGRNLIKILQSRNHPEAVITYIGPAEIDDSGTKTKVEQVAIAVHGATNTLKIDPTTGRIVSQAYRAAGPRLALGTVEKTFSDYSLTGGVTLPLTATVTFDGKAIPESPISLKFIHLNESVDPMLFEPPGS